MPKTVQIRNIDDHTYRVLQIRAGKAGISVPELLKREIQHYANRPTMEEWLERVQQGPRSNITVEQVNASLDELRGPWPHAGS